MCRRSKVDTESNLINLRKVLEEEVAPNKPAKGNDKLLESAHPDAIRKGVFDLDDLITRSEVCSTTLGKFAEYVEADHVRQSMFSVQTDLSSAVIKMRRIFNEMHVALGGRA